MSDKEKKQLEEELKLVVEQIIKETFDNHKMALLKEDDGGDGGDYSGAGGYDWSGYGGGGDAMGGSRTGPGSLYHIFIDPLVDIGKTTAYGVESLTAKTWYMFRTLVRGVAAVLNPFQEAEFNDIEDDEKRTLEAVNAHYKQVLDANMAVLQDNDFWGVFCMLYPEMFMAEKFVQKAPWWTADILRVIGLRGASQKIRNTLFGMRRFMKQTEYKYEKYGEMSDTTGDIARPGSAETKYAAAKGTTDEMADYLNSALKDPGLRQEIRNSEYVQKTKRSGTEMTLARVRDFMAIKSFADLSKYLSKAEGFQDLKNKVSGLEKQGVPGPELEKIKKNLLVAAKKEYKGFYTRKLQGLLQQNPDPLVAKVLQDIRQLPVI